MRLLLILVWATLTAASGFHYAPTKLLLEKVDTLPLAQSDTAPANTQYHEQDSGGFYSYGYSADRSAKAEYLTVDGSSKGFYSYIDADGKLQTVKYEAGKKQGFKAAATNLPKAPKNPNAAAPLPVKDTPEVQQAKKAHFEAYREAELRAALATQKDANEAEMAAQLQLDAQEQAAPPKDARMEQETAHILENTRNRILAILAESADAQNGNKNAGLNGGDDQLQSVAGAGAEADVPESLNNGFLNVDQFQSNGEDEVDVDVDDADDAVDEQRSNGADNLATENGDDDMGNDAAAAALSSSAHRQMTTYKLPDLLSNGGAHLNDHALYTFEQHNGEQSVHGKELLHLTELQHKSDVSFVSAPQLTTIETVRMPVHSYYTVLAPNTKYSVITPTTLTSVPRAESLKRGHSLPISLSSSFLSHRLKAK